MAEPAYVNGFVDGSDLVLLYRDARGEMRARRKPAEWSSFYKTADLARKPEVLRDLRSSSIVTGIRDEGEYTRIRWSRRRRRRRRRG